MPNVLRWKFKIFAKTVNGANILHDDGTLLRYIVKLGFQTDFYLMIIHEMAKFYDIEFWGGLLFTIESGHRSRTDILNAANTIAEYFETLAREKRMNHVCQSSIVLRCKCGQKLNASYNGKDMIVQQCPFCDGEREYLCYCGKPLETLNWDPYHNSIQFKPCACQKKEHSDE